MFVEVSTPCYASPDVNADTAVDLLYRSAPVTAHGEHKRLLAAADFGSRIVAVGEMGLIIYSDDNGESWTQANVPASVMLTAITALDEQVGFAVGHDGVCLSTQDAGANWRLNFDGNIANSLVLANAKALVKAAANSSGSKEEIESLQEAADGRLADAEAANETGPSLPLFGIAFINAQQGFSVGAFGQLFETRDAGKRWSYVGDKLANAEGLHLNAISISTRGTLFVAAEAGVVFVSRDNGNTWSRTELGYNGQIYGVLELPEAQGALIAYGFAGRLFTSADNGKHWSSLDSPVDKAIVGGVILADGSPLLVTQDGRLINSLDAGHSFFVLEQSVSFSKISGVSIGLDKRTIFTVGPNGIERLRIMTRAGKKS